MKGPSGGAVMTFSLSGAAKHLEEEGPFVRCQLGGKGVQPPPKGGGLTVASLVIVRAVV
jgi:hypothetical protein